MAAELGSFKQAHTSLPPLTLGNSRVVEGPAPLKELGSRAQAMRGELSDIEDTDDDDAEPRASATTAMQHCSSPAPSTASSSPTRQGKRKRDDSQELLQYLQRGRRDERGPTLEPGLGLGLAGERLVAGSLPTGPGRAQPEMATWVRLPVGSPPAGRSMRGRCNVVWVAVVAGGLDDPIPGPKLWQ
ncbi:hypothetical protein L3Q82_004589 [Scortum barcoo]|uniref:Uncharacterized protein n=1 Tax=Scortum barcoo TaxID=214431 RepID=A0ACB8VHB4_9TELE|nr:hypothetical protein L3Q82_004589 [Scortum barcoo]